MNVGVREILSSILGFRTKVFLKYLDDISQLCGILVAGMVNCRIQDKSMYLVM